MAGVMDAGTRIATVIWQGNATAGVVSITISARPNLRFIVTGISISGSAAPSGAVEFTLKEGSTYLEGFQIPAAAFSPIVINYGSHPLMSPTPGTALTCVLPSLGGSAVGQVVVKGFYATA